jgi:hypothetical protein
MASWLRPWVLTAGLAGALFGCKQGEGEYCQIPSDCQDGLDCNPSTNVCEGSSTPTIDASLGGPDAAVPDAGAVTIDAGGTVDAIPILPDAPAATPDAPAAAPDAAP